MNDLLRSLQVLREWYFYVNLGEVGKFKTFRFLIVIYFGTVYFPYEVLRILSSTQARILAEFADQKIPQKHQFCLESQCSPSQCLEYKTSIPVFTFFKALFVINYSCCLTIIFGKMKTTELLFNWQSPLDVL